MTPPRQTHVGNHVYQITVGDYEDLRDGALRGETNHRLLVIRLQDGRPESQVYVTLLHELLHCVDYVWREGEDELPEKTVKVLAQGLAQALTSLGIVGDKGAGG